MVLGAICRTSLLAGAAWAAVATTGYAQATSNEVGVEEVVVTAQRRSERLQDVPMAVTALTQDTLKKAGVAGTADIARVTPGLVLPYYGGGIQPSLRGVSSQGAGPGDSSNIAIYLDGVYQPNPFGNLFDLADAQQIEVLKGPQGTLYGQNATGGAIIITTAKPSFTPTGRLELGGGNYDDKRAIGYISAPITNNLAFSVSGLYEDRDGFRRHVITGERDKGLTSKLLRGKLLFQPDENVDITLSSFWSRYQDSSSFAGSTFLGNTVGKAFFPTFPRATSPKQFEADPVVGTTVDSGGMGLNTDIHTDLGVLSSVTSYVRVDTHYVADIDFSPVRYAISSYGPDILPTPYRFRTFVQEVNFASRKIGGFTFTTGLFYMDGSTTADPSAFELHVPVLVPAPYGPVVFQGARRSRVSKKSWAVYLEGSYDITDRLVVSLGGRYSSEQQTGQVGPNGDAFGALTEYGRRTFKKFTPRVTARYAVTPHDNIYASVSRGFKSGIVQYTGPFATPEVLTAYEVGYKGRPTDKVELNVAAFYYDYKDLQVFRYTLNNSVLSNAARARIKGIDVDAHVAVTDQLTVNAAVSLLDGKYKSFPSAATFAPLPTGGNATVVADLTGTRISRAPKFTANLSMNYTMPTSAGEFGVYAGAYYNDGYIMELSGKIRQKAYTTLDGELSFSPAALKNLRLVIWGRNITDATYFQGALVSALADGVAYAPPRTFGARAEYKF